MDQQIVVYKPSEKIRMEVKTDGETVWLTQEQMCQLFGRERSVITKHIRNVFREGELDNYGHCLQSRRHHFRRISREVHRGNAISPVGDIAIARDPPV